MNYSTERAKEAPKEKNSEQKKIMQENDRKLFTGMTSCNMTSSMYNNVLLELSKNVDFVFQMEK